MFLLHDCHSKSGTLLCSSILMCSHESLTQRTKADAKCGKDRIREYVLEVQSIDNRACTSHKLKNQDDLCRHFLTYEISGHIISLLPCFHIRTSAKYDGKGSSPSR